MNTEKTPPQESNISIGSIPGLVSVSKVHMNVSEEVIVTTEDKVRLALSKHLVRMEKKMGWLAPFSLVLSLILTLVTASFRNLGLEAATWKAIFIIWLIFAVGWLILSVWQVLHSGKMEDVIEELKKGANQNQ